MQIRRVQLPCWLLAAALPMTNALASGPPEPEATHFEVYVDWQVEDYEIKQPLAGLTGAAERGRAIAGDQYRGNCVACHQLPIPEQPFHGNLGPPLAGIASRQSVGMIRLHVVDQTRFNPETVMPGYYRRPSQLNRIAPELQGRTFLTAQEIEDVVAYLATLK